MAQMALSSTFCNSNIHIIKHHNGRSFPRVQLSQKQSDKNPISQIKRSGEKPGYLGVQEKQPSLALCPATNNCVSTSENVADLTHYVPPWCSDRLLGTHIIMLCNAPGIAWNYNPEGREDRVSKEEAMEELIDVIESTIPPENFTPRVVERTEDYLRVEYQSPILGLVDDVEFWFPPNKDSIVEYRSASRLGNFDFDVNRRRVKALRLELEKRGWASQDSI
ncbi:hypothetical protein RIF29_30080 [Crotalaria pallida]|uniref:DUF1499 family protein n=1 Tax=Crotalaria pallida TaxID=3830 RepID=A0AAN9EG09_CROPI